MCWKTWTHARTNSRTRETPPKDHQAHEKEVGGNETAAAVRRVHLFSRTLRRQRDTSNFTIMTADDVGQPEVPTEHRKLCAVQLQLLASRPALRSAEEGPDREQPASAKRVIYCTKSAVCIVGV